MRLSAGVSRSESAFRASGRLSITTATRSRMEQRSSDVHVPISTALVVVIGQPRPPAGSLPRLSTG